MNWKVALFGSAFAVTAFFAGVKPASATALPNANHYACYQVKAKTATPADATLTAGNGLLSGTATKCKLKFVCVPVKKNANAIVDASLNYKCWQCKAGKPAVTLNASDQYGNDSVTTKKFKFLCNPALVN